MLEKTYQPAAIEPRIREQWEKADAFRAGPSDRSKADAEPYCIVIPPPNVTGSLHMGHALNTTLQDILCRFERMRGRDVLWQPGMDHAGIATQMVVERQMADRGEPGRRVIGREAFVEKVWAWKDESGGMISNQLRRLGASCDWSRERFTMDEGLSQAVIKVFVELHEAGLIYRDKRLVNWDPKFQTAISDLEVEQIETRGRFEWDSGAEDAEPFDAAALAKVLAKDPSGHMYHFRYPLAQPIAGFDGDAIVVATTRPETMLGDSGVAVHPEDERYQALVAAGATVMLPLVGRQIPIVADEYSDPEKGTGAVKITPAHDFNDFEVGRRHDLEKIAILDAEGRINDAAPELYRGMDRFLARLRIVEDMAAAGLLVKIEPTTHTVPHGDRSGVVIEPMLTDQWYCDAKTLAGPAIEAVEAGAMTFVPKNWEKTYFEWMRNIEPWCISRQLWWGHRIPAWFGPDGTAFVAADADAALAKAIAHYIADGTLSQQDADALAANGAVDSFLRRDEDVLDTWFSSALWPFSTLGWPDATPELQRYYPTSVLLTGFDIIFFWVARMMMMGLHFKQQVPFHEVYIHALVRDAKGQKMSKSKGNVIDPLSLVDQYGADALRFTLAAMAAQGRDIKLDTNRVEGYRNFATKLWNAARFAEMNECVRQHKFDPAKVDNTVNKWIVGEVERAVASVTHGLESYKFNEAAASAYEFTWGVFCDWYVELSKPVLAGSDEVAKAETRATVAWTLDQILKLLHPFMPFITEELWAHMVEHGERRQKLLTQSTWPKIEGLQQPDADAEIGWLIEAVSEVRSVRSEMNIPAGAQIPLVFVASDGATRQRAERNMDTLGRLSRLDDIRFVETVPKGAAQMVVGDATMAVPLDGVIDMDVERQRLEKEVAASNSDLAKMDAKLANPKFMERAKPEAIEETLERKAELESRLQKLSAALRWIEA